MPHSSSENVSVNRLCSLTRGAAANAPPETTIVSARAPAKTRASLRMVAPSGIQMFLGESSLTGLLLTASAARCLATGEETASPLSASASGVHVRQSGQCFTDRHELALLCPTHSKTPRTEIGGALGRAAGGARHRRTRREPVTACPPCATSRSRKATNSEQL